VADNEWVNFLLEFRQLSFRNGRPNIKAVVIDWDDVSLDEGDEYFVRSVG